MSFCLQTRLNLLPSPIDWLEDSLQSSEIIMGRTDQRPSCQCNIPSCISHELHRFLWSRRNQRKSKKKLFGFLVLFLVHPSTTHVLGIIIKIVEKALWKHHAWPWNLKHIASPCKYMKDGFFLFYSVTPAVLCHHLRWFTMPAGTISLMSYCIFLGSLPGAMKECSQRQEKR